MSTSNELNNAVIKAAIRTLEDEVQNFDDTFTEGAKVRSHIQTLLVSSLPNQIAADPETAAAQLKLVDTTLSTLAAAESAATKRVALKQKLNGGQDELAADIGKILLALASSQRSALDKLPLDLEVDQAALDAQTADMEIQDFELRESPDDLS